MNEIYFIIMGLAVGFYAGVAFGAYISEISKGGAR